MKTEIMEEQNFVNFKKVRGLGDMLSDTFKFLSVEWKPFFGTIIKISIIPVLIAIGFALYFVMSFMPLYADLLQFNQYENDINFNFSQLLIPFIGFIFAYLVAYALVTVASLSYIKSYVENKGVVNYKEIQNLSKENFWSYVGLFFLVGIIVGFGLLFCFVPGIYLGVVLSLSICLLIFQNKGVFDAINDSFGFIKEHWWETFGILIVVQILIGVAGYIINLPATLYMGTDMAAMIQNQEATELISIFSDPVYLGFLGFAYLAKFILYIFSVVVTVFIYFDIKEQKNPSSDMINEIGVL
ncbi:hypothetical protein KO506_14585 [Polaribacter vadi]|uniref:hypothetical protein n=1 Tax=Polaribacter TaxID=52959 RepID=UPI001C09D2B2|nr:MULTISPECIES: hypothetical protein [Polaribacter]MBU3012637.1 hypothetical protein [Polaribacter vadi]MDO6742455.1 hypothetical protein [Polaribacter sp. 1_MG-2023]